MSDTNALLTLIAQAAGVDETQLTALLGQVSQATESAPKADMNPGDVAHELALQKGYVPAKGRVYLTKAVIEAASQTEVDAQPRIVDLNDNRALVMFKTKSGDVAAQNYYKRSR